MANSARSEARWYFVEPRDSRLPAAEFEIRVEETGEGSVVHVTAATIIRSLSLLVDRLSPDATVDDALVDLLPGESATFVVAGAPGATAADFAAPEVLRTANELVRWTQ